MGYSGRFQLLKTQRDFARFSNVNKGYAAGVSVDPAVRGQMHLFLPFRSIDAKWLSLRQLYMCHYNTPEPMDR